MKDFKIISGGQTGVDRIALEVASKLNIMCGGTAPKGYLTENGSDYSLADFNLKEHSSSKYPARTKSNVQESDGTVYFATDTNSRGLKLTKKICIENNKPFILNPTADNLVMFVKKNNITCLNIAGNRGSKLNDTQVSNIEKLLENFLSTLLELS